MSSSAVRVRSSTLYLTLICRKREAIEVSQDLSQTNLPQPYCNPDNAVLIDRE